MTPRSLIDDDIPLLLQAYNSMEPNSRSDFRASMGLTLEGRRSWVRTYERRQRAASAERSSDEVVAVRVPRATKRFEILFDRGVPPGRTRSGRYRSAPPSRGGAATGRFGLRGRPGASVIRIVIVLTGR